MNIAEVLKELFGIFTIQEIRSDWKLFVAAIVTALIIIALILALIFIIFEDLARRILSLLFVNIIILELLSWLLKYKKRQQRKKIESLQGQE